MLHQNGTIRKLKRRKLVKVTSARINSNSHPFGGRKFVSEIVDDISVSNFGNSLDVGMKEKHYMVNTSLKDESDSRENEDTNQKDDASSVCIDIIQCNKTSENTINSMRTEDENTLEIDSENSKSDLQTCDSSGYHTTTPCQDRSIVFDYSHRVVEVCRDATHEQHPGQIQSEFMSSATASVMMTRHTGCYRRNATKSVHEYRWPRDSSTQIIGNQHVHPLDANGFSHIIEPVSSLNCRTNTPKGTLDEMTSIPDAVTQLPGRSPTPMQGLRLTNTDMTQTTSYPDLLSTHTNTHNIQTQPIPSNCSPYSINKNSNANKGQKLWKIDTMYPGTHKQFFRVMRSPTGKGGTEARVKEHMNYKGQWQNQGDFEGQGSGDFEGQGSGDFRHDDCPSSNLTEKTFIVRGRNIEVVSLDEGVNSQPRDRPLSDQSRVQTCVVGQNRTDSDIGKSNLSPRHRHRRSSARLIDHLELREVLNGQHPEDTNSSTVCHCDYDDEGGTLSDLGDFSPEHTKTMNFTWRQKEIKTNGHHYERFPEIATDGSKSIPVTSSCHSMVQMFNHQHEQPCPTVGASRAQELMHNVNRRGEEKWEAEEEEEEEDCSETPDSFCRCHERFEDNDLGQRKDVMEKSINGNSMCHVPEQRHYQQQDGINGSKAEVCSPKNGKNRTTELSPLEVSLLCQRCNAIQTLTLQDRRDQHSISNRNGFEQRKRREPSNRCVKNAVEDGCYSYGGSHSAKEIDIAQGTDCACSEHNTMESQVRDHEDGKLGTDGAASYRSPQTPTNVTLSDSRDYYSQVTPFVEGGNRQRSQSFICNRSKSNSGNDITCHGTRKDEEIEKTVYHNHHNQHDQHPGGSRLDTRKPLRKKHAATITPDTQNQETQTMQNVQDAQIFNWSDVHPQVERHQRFLHEGGNRNCSKSYSICTSGKPDQVEKKDQSSQTLDLYCASDKGRMESTQCKYCLRHSNEFPVQSSRVSMPDNVSTTSSPSPVLFWTSRTSWHSGAEPANSEDISPTASRETSGLSFFPRNEFDNPLPRVPNDDCNIILETNKRTEHYNACCKSKFGTTEEKSDLSKCDMWNVPIRFVISRSDVAKQNYEEVEKTDSRDPSVECLRALMQAAKRRSHDDVEQQVHANSNSSNASVTAATSSTFLSDYIVKLWENQWLCDVEITVNGQKLLAHKLVLAAFSDVFCPNTPTPPPSVIFDIPDSTPQAVEQILRYIYTSKMNLNDAILEPVLCAALYIGFSEVVNLVMDIIQFADATNVEQYMGMCQRRNIEFNFLTTPAFRKHIGELVETDIFSKLTLNQMHMILDDPSVEVESEEVTLKAVIKWALGNQCNDGNILAGLLKKISLQTLPVPLLRSIMDEYPGIFKAAGVTEFMMDVFSERASTVYGSVLGYPENQYNMDESYSLDVIRPTSVVPRPSQLYRSGSEKSTLATSLGIPKPNTNISFHSHGVNKPDKVTNSPCNGSGCDRRNSTRTTRQSLSSPYSNASIQMGERESTVLKKTSLSSAASRESFRYNDKESSRQVKDNTSVPNVSRYSNCGANQAMGKYCPIMPFRADDRAASVTAIQSRYRRVSDAPLRASHRGSTASGNQPMAMENQRTASPYSDTSFRSGRRESTRTGNQSMSSPHGAPYRSSRRSSTNNGNQQPMPISYPDKQFHPGGNKECMSAVSDNHCKTTPRSEARVRFNCDDLKGSQNPRASFQRKSSEGERLYTPSSQESLGRSYTVCRSDSRPEPANVSMSNASTSICRHQEKKIIHSQSAYPDDGLNTVDDGSGRVESGISIHDTPSPTQYQEKNKGIQKHHTCRNKSTVKETTDRSRLRFMKDRFRNASQNHNDGCLEAGLVDDCDRLKGKKQRWRIQHQAVATGEEWRKQLCDDLPPHERHHHCIQAGQEHRDVCQSQNNNNGISKWQQRVRSMPYTDFHSKSRVSTQTPRASPPHLPGEIRNEINEDYGTLDRGYPRPQINGLDTNNCDTVADVFELGYPSLRHDVGLEESVNASFDDDDVNEEDDDKTLVPSNETDCTVGEYVFEIDGAGCPLSSTESSFGNESDTTNVAVVETRSASATEPTLDWTRGIDFLESRSLTPNSLAQRPRNNTSTDPSVSRSLSVLGHDDSTSAFKEYRH